MSRERGNRLQNALAAYLRPWWPHAESAGSGRNGRDVLGTPCVWWECKTSGTRLRPGEFLRQAEKGARKVRELPVVVWFPPKDKEGEPGVGARNTGQAIAMLRLCDLMALFVASGITPMPAPTVVPSPTPSSTSLSSPPPPPTSTPKPAPAPPPTPSSSPTLPSARNADQTPGKTYHEPRHRRLFPGNTHE